MRLHTDVLTLADIYKAVEGMPNVYATVTAHGSRSHDRAFEVKLSGNGTYKNSGAYGPVTDEAAATWDEWGIFLAALYKIDGAAVWGSVKHPVYRDAADFHWQTQGRFHALTWQEQHKRHRWTAAEVFHRNRETYAACKCGAERAWTW